MVRQMAHHSCEFSRMISRSSGVGRSCRSEAIKDFDLLYCARDMGAGSSLRFITSLSKSDRAGALAVASPGNMNISSDECKFRAGLLRLSRTFAMKQIRIQLNLTNSTTYLLGCRLAWSEFEAVQLVRQAMRHHPSLAACPVPASLNLPDM